MQLAPSGDREACACKSQRIIWCIYHLLVLISNQMILQDLREIQFSVFPLLVLLMQLDHEISASIIR